MGRGFRIEVGWCTGGGLNAWAEIGGANLVRYFLRKAFSSKDRVEEAGVECLIGRNWSKVVEVVDFCEMFES